MGRVADEANADDLKSESRRARQRRELLVEITDEARRLLDSGGTGAVSWRGIARAVGLSPASLYTYFESLDDLFTELLLQSYGRLSASVEAAIAAFADAPLGDRLLVGPLAYRRWALANRGQFNLIFTDQLPGYTATPGGPTVDAQIAIFRPMVALLAEAQRVGFDETLMGAAGPHREMFLGLWGTFHGLTTLEVNHHLDWVDAEQTYDTQLRWYLRQLHFPAAAPDVAARFDTLVAGQSESFGVASGDAGSESAAIDSSSPVGTTTVAGSANTVSR